MAQAAESSPTSVTVQVVLPASLVDSLRLIASNRGIGLSTLIRMLLYASVEQ